MSGAICDRCGAFGAIARLDGAGTLRAWVCRRCWREEMTYRSKANRLSGGVALRVAKFPELVRFKAKREGDG